MTAQQREQINSLLDEGMEDSREIAAKVGVTPGTVAAIKAWATIRQRGREEEVDEDVAKALDTTFGLERDLQTALRNNIEQLEPGLTIIDGGHEKKVTSGGLIDITARDKDDWTVVIELKASTAERDAIGQILSYMGDLTDGTTRVRGVVIAKDFSPKAISAARATSNVQLRQYSFQFKFETVSTVAKKA